MKLYWIIGPEGDAIGPYIDLPGDTKLLLNKGCRLIAVEALDFTEAFS